MKIAGIQAREILSSGSFPTLEARVNLKNGLTGVASVPFGASTGSHEAMVLLDGDQKRFLGQGMLKAVENVNKIIAPKLLGKDVCDQKKIDQTMIELDGTENKKKLGANAILGVSLSCARAAALASGLPLYKYIRQTYQLTSLPAYQLPRPLMVMIEGGKHAENSTDLQEYMIAPIGAASVREAIRWGIECYLHLKKILHKKGYATTIGNEGAFAPAGLKNNEAPFSFIMAAIKAAGYRFGKDIALALDPAVSEIFSKGKYYLKRDKKILNSKQMIECFGKWIKKYPIISLEDPLAEDDWEAWQDFNSKLKTQNSKLMLVGDDLTVTNPERLKKAIALKAINTILIKLNQIGTLSETVDVCEIARKNSIDIIVSHRGGGETNDTLMIDLAVAVNAKFVKVGPSRGERVEKYNRLMEIEEEINE